MTGNHPELESLLAARLRPIFKSVVVEHGSWRILEPQSPVNLWHVARDLADSDEEADELWSQLVDLEGEGIVHYRWYGSAPISWTDGVARFDFDPDRTYVALTINEDLDRDYMAIYAIEPSGNQNAIRHIARLLLADGYHAKNCDFPGVVSLPTELSCGLAVDELVDVAVAALDAADMWPAQRERLSSGGGDSITDEERAELARQYVEGAFRP